MSDIERVKDAIRLETYIPGLKKAGRLFKMCCPLHSERTASFVVNPETQTWRCYGACATGGDVFSFVMQRDRCTFAEALTMLADHARVTLTPRTRTAIQSDAQSARVDGLLKTVADLYHDHLMSEEGRSAYQYLTETRGLTRETITTWQLGLAPARWTWLTDQLTALGYVGKELKILNLVRVSDAGRAYDFFRNRLIFPIRDARGHLRGFGGRDMGQDGPKYINSAQSEAFSKSSLLYGLDRAKGAIRQAGRAVVVEGYMDVLTAHQAGYTNVVAQMGTAFTPDQLALLTQHTSTIVLALDGDEAGQTATHRAAETHIKSATDLRVLLLDEGTDPDELIRSHPQEWQSAVDEAPALVDVVIQQAVAALPQTANVLQKQALQARLTPILTAPANMPYTQENFAKLASALDLPVPTARPALTVLPGTPKPSALPSPLEMAVLHNLIVNDDAGWYQRVCGRLVVACPHDLPYALCTLRPIDFPHVHAQRLMGLIVTAVSAGEDVCEYVQGQALGTDLEDVFVRVYGLLTLTATPRHDTLADMFDLVFRLRINRLKEDMKVLSGLGDEISIARWNECARGVAYLTAGLRAEGVKHG